ncbi:MAG TPA: phage holin family protein [Nocardioidaceae bacterium]|jgi:fatty acid desaturase
MTTPHGPDAEEPTIGKLVADTSRDLSALVRGEIELAKTELKFSVRAGGIAIGLFVAAAFLVLLAIVMISIAFAYFLHWLYFGLGTSYLIVFVVYVLIAALLGFIGSRKMKQVKAPEQTMAAVKSNKQVLKRT